VAFARMQLFGERSLRATAAKAGISPSDLSRIERGQRKSPGLEHVLALCDVLGVRLEWLLFGRGEMMQDHGDDPAPARKKTTQ
jgi:transcriptional regulator with XRE-family HTH domain